MQGVAWAQGRQRSRFTSAVPMTTCRFSSNGQRRDGAGRTDLAAAMARIVAVADARHQHRRPQPLQAGLPQRRLQPRGGAHLHALPAADAPRPEIVPLRARRPDERIGHLPLARHTDGTGRAPPAPTASEASACRRDGSYRCQAAGCVCTANRTSSLGQATTQSRHTVHSAGSLAKPRCRIDRAGRTGPRAALAAGAGRAHRPAHQRDLSTSTPAGPPAGKVAAPETLGDAVEGDHADQSGNQQQVGPVERLICRQPRRAEVHFEPFHRPLQKRHRIEQLLERAEADVQRRQEANRQGPGQQGNRIQEVSVRPPSSAAEQESPEAGNTSPAANAWRATGPAAFLSSAAGTGRVPCPTGTTSRTRPGQRPGSAPGSGATAPAGRSTPAQRSCSPAQPADRGGRTDWTGRNGLEPRRVARIR